MNECKSCGGRGGGHQSWCANDPRWSDQRGHHRLATACVAIDCQEVHEALQVHNHGTEDGPGLACNEGTLGACQLQFLQTDAVRNAASMFFGLAVNDPNRAYTASRVAELLLAFAGRYGNRPATSRTKSPAGGGDVEAAPSISASVAATAPPAGLSLVRVCPDCGSTSAPVRRGECPRCGSDRGQLHVESEAKTLWKCFICDEEHMAGHAHAECAECSGSGTNYHGDRACLNCEGKGWT